MSVSRSTPAISGSVGSETAAPNSDISIFMANGVKKTIISNNTSKENKKRRKTHNNKGTNENQ